MDIEQLVKMREELDDMINQLLMSGEYELKIMQLTYKHEGIEGNNDTLLHTLLHAVDTTEVKLDGLGYDRASCQKPINRYD